MERKNRYHRERIDGHQKISVNDIIPMGMGLHVMYESNETETVECLAS